MTRLSLAIVYPVLLALFQLNAMPAGNDSRQLDGWTEYSQRSALKQVFKKDPVQGILEIASCGDFRCNGAWVKSFPVEAERYYHFSARYRSSNVDLPRRSILARVEWKDREGKRVEHPEYPELKFADRSDWKLLEDIVQAPAGSATAEVELVFRWDADGKVEWKDVSLASVDKLAPRMVKLGTVNYRDTKSSGPEENRKAYGKYIEEAGRAGADILCLPEGMTLVGTGKTYLEVAEPVPGPTTRFLGNLARKHQMYLIAGIIEKVGDTAYNTAVLIGKDGELVGKYRKVSLPREEIEGGITPGSEFPVFDTEFGRIGILICWDIQFPEGARRLAEKGVEIILLPIWGGTEPLYPARAIENQIFLVSSSYDSTTAIWNQRGEVLAKADQEGSLAITVVDLNEKIYWEWLGNLRGRISRESPPVDEVEAH